MPLAPPDFANATYTGLPPSWLLNLGGITEGQAPASLTPEALMTYLKTRLQGLDSQINGIFNKQQSNLRIQQALRKAQDFIAGLPKDSSKYKGSLKKDIEAALSDLKTADPALAAKVETQLEQPGQVLEAGDSVYDKTQLQASKDYLDNLAKDLNSGAQLDMIHLQSLMSSRQTAVQLSTNLISALGNTTKSIAANIGK